VYISYKESYEPATVEEWPPGRAGLDVHMHNSVQIK
jgi:hypothetical protein